MNKYLSGRSILSILTIRQLLCIVFIDTSLFFSFSREEMFALNLCPNPSFSAPTNFGAGNGPYFVVVGDFNSDGKQDLAVVNNYTVINSNTLNAAGKLTILLRDGSGSFSPGPGSPISAGNSPSSAAIGDFNSDGNQDIAVASPSDNNLRIFLGDGSGSFSPAPGSPISVAPPGAAFFPVSVAVGDFNGDGKQDLVTANSGINPGEVKLLLGNGNGSFSLTSGPPLYAGGTSIAVGDFNNDGKQDLAVANTVFNGTITILLGNGSGGFSITSGSPISVGTNPSSIAIGDFNADGKQDLAVANPGSTTVTILMGGGSGDFSSAGSPLVVGNNPDSVAVGDFNADGKQDIAVANFHSSDVVVLIGNGTGSFSPHPNSPLVVGSNPRSVAVGDFNGDGKQDLAVANQSSNNLSILLNNCIPNTPPTITCPANIGTSADQGQCYATVNPGTATATDSAGNSITPVGTRSDGRPLTENYPVGITIITWSATDSFGNSASCQQNIAVTDSQLPTVTAPPNLIVLTGAGGAGCGMMISNDELSTATASDNCGSATVLRSGVPVGNFFPVGTTNITYTATDQAGNVRTATQTITVQDTTAPIISCPASIIVDGNNSSGGAVATFSVTATDNCDSSPSISVTMPSGRLFSFGTTTVTATATDGSGNSSQCSFTVTVRSPQAQTTQVLNQVQAMVTGGTLTQNQGAGLIDKLNQVIDKLNSGQSMQACNQLNAFVNQVNGFISAGNITLSQGQALINAANALKANIGC